MNSLSLIKQCRAVNVCQKEARDAVGNALRRAEEELAIDETAGYFMVQADHARANEKFAARLQELLAAKRAAA